MGERFFVVSLRKHSVFKLFVFVIRTFDIRICRPRAMRSLFRCGFNLRISIFEFWQMGFPFSR